MKSLLMVLVITTFAATGWASESWTEASAANTFFTVAIGGIHQSAGGDFDGESFFYAPNEYGFTELFVVPEIDGAVCWITTVGARWNGAELDVSYARGRHDMAWAGFPAEGELWATDVNLKAYASIGGPAEIYLLVGAGAVHVQIEDGYTLYDEYTGESKFAEARYNGGSLNLGTGVVYHATPHLAVQAGAIYRWRNFQEVDSDESFYGPYDIEHLEVQTLDVTAEIVFYLGKV
jgi:opacity protein-like surface antigen